MITDQTSEERRPPPPVPAEVADARARVTDFEQHTRTWIRQRPIVALLVALGAGYLTARLVSRVVR